MIVAFTGGRDFADEAAFGAVINAIDAEWSWRVGDCPTGLDAMLRRYHCGNIADAEDPGHQCQRLDWLYVYTADWTKHGKAAGPIRNRAMLTGADLLVAFPGYKGTADCVRQAHEMGIPVLRVEP